MDTLQNILPIIIDFLIIIILIVGIILGIKAIITIGKVDKIVDDLSEDVIEHIHFTGYIEDEDLPSIYHFANLF